MRKFYFLLFVLIIVFCIFQKEKEEKYLIVIPTKEESKKIRKSKSFKLTNTKHNRFSPKEIKKIYKHIEISAYNSSTDQCDGDPHITASGSKTRWGIIACNFLEFGQKVKIPKLFGDQIFVVEDRMATKNWKHVDVWMKNKSEALQLGRVRADILIID